MRNRLLNQLKEINKLVITPVANICPGVLGFGPLPIDTLTCNAIRVITISSGRVHEL